MNRQSRGAIRQLRCRIAVGNRRTVHRIEDKLINSQKFSLPGKKSLLTTNKEWSAIIIDVAESPIERPKKNRKVTTVERRKNTL